MGDLNLVLSALNLFALEAGHFDNGATSKIDYVITKHGGIIHVLTLAVHLKKILKSYFSWVGLCWDWPGGSGN